MKKLNYILFFILFVFSIGTTYENYRNNKRINELEEKILKNETYVIDELLANSKCHLQMAKQIGMLAKQDGETLDMIGILNKTISYKYNLI